MCNQLIYPLLEMNKLTLHLPCLEHMGDFLSNLPEVDKLYSKIEMCNNVLVALPALVSMVYWATKGKYFSVDIKELEEDVSQVEK